MANPRKQDYGGDWTELKLEVLVAYLKSYLDIFNKRGSKASHFRTTYVDAFAGSGQRVVDPRDNEAVLQDDLAQMQRVFTGSAIRVL